MHVLCLAALDKLSLLKDTLFQMSQVRNIQSPACAASEQAVCHLYNIYRSLRSHFRSSKYPSLIVIDPKSSTLSVEVELYKVLCKHGKQQTRGASISLKMLFRKSSVGKFQKI
jgi:hypothetical protein